MNQEQASRGGMNVFVLNPGSSQTKNIVRDLIYGCWCKGKRIGGMTSPPMNLLMIATVLSDQGHKVEFRDAQAQGTPARVVDKIIRSSDIIILNTSTMTFIEDTALLNHAKEINPRIKTIAFGSHPTFKPEECLKAGIDFVVRKEPEFIIRDLVNALAIGKNHFKKVKGIGYLDNEDKTAADKRTNKRTAERKDNITGVHINEDYGFPDLDDLPIPNRHFLPKEVDYFNPLVKKIPYTTMITSRGCPALCTFCTVPSFYGKKIRARSEELVLKELKEIKKQGYREVWIRDETFTVYKKRNINICREMIKQKLNLSWICNARIGSIDKETMKLMKKAGCHMIKFGVESGVQRILDNVKKGISVDKTIETFKWAHEIGMDTHAHMMLGMPGETYQSIMQTIEFAKKIDPTTVSFGICTPYAGTPLFEEIAKKDPSIMDGSSCDLNVLHEKSYFNQHYTKIKPDDLEKFVQKAYRKFYLRPYYLFRWLLRIKSMDELRRVLLAGSNVFSFSVNK